MFGVHSDRSKLIVGADFSKPPGVSVAPDTAAAIRVQKEGYVLGAKKMSVGP
jgi:hypothetical protein